MFDNIKTQLGKPYYENKDCLIYCGDCLELMRQLKDPFIDLTVTSPPYNIGKEYESTMSLEDYLMWCKDWVDAIYNITSETGSLVVFTKGVRGGKYYEDDTFRLEKKLI